VEREISLLDVPYVRLRHEISLSPRLRTFSALTLFQCHLKNDFFRCYYLVEHTSLKGIYLSLELTRLKNSKCS
ncbi:MAG: hypothetical protein KDD60_03090, partial [Bdellovibrionales bacterium]|nr:hypothetical protein [Bdellovibrionales bacterium]